MTDEDEQNNIIAFPMQPPRPQPKVRIAQPAVRNLPAKVRIRDGRYYYRHQGKDIGLTRVDAGAAALYEALQDHTSERPSTYGELMLLYIARALPDLRPATQHEYLRQINSRLQHHFGHMLLNTLKSEKVAQYLALRKREGAPKGGNRERSTLSTIISWGMSEGWLTTANPCYGIRRNKETPSKVYVEDAELVAALDCAPPYMANILAVAYLTGLRQGDLRELTRENITNKGIELRQSKDQKLRIITWTPRLKYFIDRALSPPPEPSDPVKQSVLEFLSTYTFAAVAHDPPSEGTKYQARGRAIRDAAAKFGVSRNTIYYWLQGREEIGPRQVAQRRAQSPFVFLGPSGRPWTKDGIQCAMKRLEKKMGGKLFCFRELRPKAASDAEHNVLGHDAQMLRTYVRAQTLKPVR